MREYFEPQETEQKENHAVDEERVVEERVHDMRQEFTERRQAVIQAEREKLKQMPYNYHYAAIPQNIIERIDATDLAMRERIRNIHDENDLAEVRGEFDQYFLELDPEKKALIGVLGNEFVKKDLEVFQKRSK